MFTNPIEKSHVEPKFPIILLNYQPSHFNDMLHWILKLLFCQKWQIALDSVHLDMLNNTDLSAESVLEVEVKQRGGGLWSNGWLKVELVSLQDVINVFGLPVDDGPEICTMIRLNVNNQIQK